MSSINSLLNHEPRSNKAAQSHDHSPSDFDPAEALTSLATLPPGQQYMPAPSRELPSPTAISDAPRRTSSFGSHNAPIEPSPPLDTPQVRSPTLEHYHHGSRSPEEVKRRQSLMSRNSPVPVLAPIKDVQTQDDRSSTQIGEDMSQIVSPQGHEAGEPFRDHTQDRQPAFVRNEPTTTQIRESSPQPIIKNEPTGTPRAQTPAGGPVLSERQNSAPAENLDVETLKAVEIAKQSDLGLRAKKAGTASDGLSSPVDSKPAPLLTKKRPSSTNPAVKKKGTAKAMKPTKKRKLESEERAVTPTSRAKSAVKRKGSHTPALESSPAPENSSPQASDDDGDSSEDHNLYCICRKPDNHKWMIGCDGGCEDWFHGDCVNMKQADEGLVDKFICPSCEENGKGNTTWKPMCRRDGCRKPAKLTKGEESKYCSEACGVAFMAEQLQRTAGAKGANGTKPKKTKKKEEEEPTPLGGILRAKDLKALVDASPNIQSFKNLGTGVLSPPQTASPTRANFGSEEDLSLTAGEISRLTALHNEKTQLNERLEVLKDREKFVSMAKEQANRVAEREKMKIKEFCGYDSRLSWSDAEFLLWRNSPRGRASFTHSTLSPTPEQIAENGGADEPEPKESVCLKKRCPKHPTWQKLNLQDARFEELEVVEAIRECEKEERSVKDRARRRGAKDGLAKELTAGDGSERERNRDGWVELVAS